MFSSLTDSHDFFRKMINVTVKTLDSQNHQFIVDDSFTVEQFKNHIADTVNVPAARQRIIYCGRVLQDNSKLADYDVDGKVVHLVQRAPPNPNTRNVRSLTPPPDLNRARGGFRGFDRVGNTVYMGMGSMTFPQGVMEPQQMFPPRATHTLSSSRLNVARRMLRNAENVIRQLENPTGANEPPPQAEEPVEEEMTPVIEARVIVPSNGDQPIDGNAILNAVQNTIFPAVGNLDSAIGPSTSTRSAEAPGGPQSSTSTPEASTPRSSSTENLNADTTPETPRDGSRQSRLRCRGTEMATLLDTLNQLQARFSPFLTRYQAFMQDDPQVVPENIQETRQMLNRVSQVLHYLGHAYHSLSDIIINVDQPPPRLLLCRPILIQPPVVQTGIPIQVEAQINLSTDRPGSTPSNTSTASSAASTNSSANANPPDSTSNVNNSSSNSTSAEQSLPQSGFPGFSVQPGFVGLPFMPTSSMRVITTPVEIRTLRANGSARPTNNNNNTSAAASSAAPSAPPAPASTAGGAENSHQPPPQNTSGQNQSQGPPSGHVVTNNGNLEFFMEVTPEALRGGNLIQSLMQLVGSQLGDTLAQAQNQRSENPIQSNQTSTTQGDSQQSQARSTQTNPTTSTHTRSTPRPHVYMTQQAVQGGFDPFLHCYSHHVTQSRPQRIAPTVDPQGSRAEPTATRENTGAAANAPNSQTSENNTTGGAPPNMPNVNAQFEDIIRGLPQSFIDIPNVFNSRQTAELVANAVTQALRQHIFPTGQGPPTAQQQRPPPAHQQRPQARQAPPPTQQTPPPAHQGAPSPAHQAPPPRGAPDGQSPLNQNNWQGRQQQQDIFGFIGRLMEQNLPDSLRRGPTLDVYVQSFHPEPYVQGESLIIDLIMLMLRNLRINDLFMISSGNMAPLQRQIDTIQGFFLTEICQNDTTDAGIARATDRVMNDFRPIIGALESIPARENIDMARTIEGFFRQRVAEIIRLAINSRSRMEGNSEQNASDLLTTIWRTSRELLALAVHCCATGQEGVESVCVDVMCSTIFNQSNVPNDLHSWTITSSRAALRTIFQNLDIGTSEIERYVVRNVPEDPSRAEAESMQQEPSCEADVAGNNVEAMDVDFEEGPIRIEPLVATPIMVDSPQPLTHVIWDSEPWHRHTPDNWVPIITRDVNKQRRQNSQQPFSDAYLSGMPSKRRKLINNSKPQGSLPQVIAESVRQAVTSTSLTAAAPLDVVAQAASESAEIQTAYRSLLQSTVRANLRDNEDFNPERFPNTARYFYESSPE